MTHIIDNGEIHAASNLRVWAGDQKHDCYILTVALQSATSIHQR